MKKLIEVALPLAEINAKTIREKRLAPGHPANLHLWWGRSPISSVQSALAASIVDAPDSEEELLERLNRVQSGNYTEFGNKPTILDPFCGFGGIPLAAQALGLPVVAGDLNPVAVMLTKASTEIPVKFSGCPPVNRVSIKKSYSGMEGLAEDVAYYGNWLREKAYEKLKNIYPTEPEGNPAAWIWVRTVKCPNPACGCQMPLASSYVLRSKRNEDIWAEPVAQEGTVRFELKTGICPKEQKSNKIGSQGAIFRCPVCGSLTTDAYVKQMGQAHQLGAQMMAIVLETEDGIHYIAPNDLQQSAANVPVPEDIPPGEIPDNPHWFSPPGFGFMNYTDLFSPRQLAMLTTLCDLLCEVQNKVASDALAAGMNASGGGLAQGGTGALAYGQAIGVYLAFVIDKMADANSTICSWRTTGGSLRNTFGRQAIPMVWTFAEGNPFSNITGNLNTVLKSVVTAIKNISCGSTVEVQQWDARTAVFPQNSMVCTEIPYYKAIGYAPLSDYFYIWMRKSLKSVYPELFNPMVTNKDELSTCGQYEGRDAGDCERTYEAQISNIFKRLALCADSSYPQLFFFEYHKRDEEALVTVFDRTSSTPLETMLNNMTQAGYAVTAVWPMRSAPVSEKADGTRILIVARTGLREGQITRRGFVANLKRDLPAILDRLFCAGVDDSDQRIVGIGGGLSIFTRYQKVLNADGSNMSMHDALQITYQEVVEYITKRAADGNLETVELEEE